MMTAPKRRLSRLLARAVAEGTRAANQPPKPNGRLRRQIERSLTARALAERTADAYSWGRYRSWEAVAALLLARGYNAREAEAIMRSKWTRWAGDMSGARYGRIPAKAVGVYLDTMAPDRRAKEVAELVAETFAGEAR